MLRWAFDRRGIFSVQGSYWVSNESRFLGSRLPEWHALWEERFLWSNLCVVTIKRLQLLFLFAAPFQLLSGLGCFSGIPFV